MFELPIQDIITQFTVVYLGLELDLVDAVTVDAIMIVILITCLVGPMLTWVAADRM